MPRMNIPEFLQSKKLVRALWALGVLVVLLLTFQLGVVVGFHKAHFSYRWADNYHRNFGGPRGGFMRDFEGREFFSGHGIAGKVVEVGGDTIVMRGSDDVERAVTVTEATVIKLARQTVPLSELKPDDSVVVIGTPREDGSTEAKLVRVFRGSAPRWPRDGFPY